MADSETKAKTKKDRAKARRLADCFNLSLEEWHKIFEYQGKKCAICKKPMNRPNVDHSHGLPHPGLVRGILCASCNRALGRFRDSIILIRAALEYLENPPATAALGKETYGFPGRLNTKRHKKWLKEKKLVDKTWKLV